MRIGILTFHRAHNYGAVLQCYALQEVLKDMGYEVEVIDYRQPFIEYVYKSWSCKRLWNYRRSPKGLIKYILREIPERNAKREIFDEFKTRFLSLSNLSGIEIPKDYDAYIIGSDQLWGRNCLGGKLDPIYFGQFEHKADSKVIGYAISSNIQSLAATDKVELTKLISNFNCLSVREQTIADYLGTTISVKPVVAIDPTLLTTPNLWESMVNRGWENRKYILVYYVIRGFGRFAHKQILKKAHHLAKKYNCEIIDLSQMNYSVSDFVSAFKYAQCVITSSFHASVFSIIYNRPLYSVKLHDGYDVRYVNLLSGLGMDNNLVDMDFEEDTIPAIDYQTVNKRLEELRQPSISYLNKALS